MKLKLIACEVLTREMWFAAARSPHQVDVEFLPKGLHDLGATAMRERLQTLLDQEEAGRHDAILLGYGLCGNGVAGLTATKAQLVIPRAHDCITLLLGSKERYQEYFDRNPGVYFRSTGWLERGEDQGQETLHAVRGRPGQGQTLDELVARYGEENGRYLYDELNAYRRTYRKLTYISTGLEPDGSFEAQAHEEAAAKNWRFESISGSLRLFERLVCGQWDERDFLLVPPGWRVTATYDGKVMDKEPAV
jgi:Protein of unknown function (DUF1638)